MTDAIVPVSVVVPTYGHAGFVLAAVESVLSQQPRPQEVIVIDDGSPDDTSERLAPLIREHRIRYVRQANAGMASARNAGARIATSEYLYFLDDDDVMFPGALSWLVDELERYPAAALVYGESVLFSDQVPPVPPTWSETWEVDPLPFILFNQLGCPGQALIRRSAFNAVGGFDPKIWGTDDWDLWLRLLVRYPARASRRPVLAYRIHGTNASRNVARMFESSLRVAKQHLPEFPAKVVLRRYTYGRLRSYHVPRLEAMLAGAVTRREWRLAAAALRAWIRAWAHELFAYLRFKVHLIRQGRWTLPADDPLRPLLRLYG